MSSNGSETKRRRLPTNEDAILEPSTKKVKVQAQRKFAQNAVTPVNSNQKPVQTLVVPSNSMKPPIKRPNTEDFLTFLCFRGTNLLPARLDFFNKPQRSAQDIASGKKRRKSTPVLPVSNANTLNNEPNERKITQLPPNKYSSTKTKIGKKVVGRNLARSNSRYTVRQETLTLRQLSLHHGSKVKNPKPKVKKLAIEVTVKKETKKTGKQVSLDGNKKIKKLKGRITRSNSLPSLFCPAINQLRDDKGKWCKGSTKTSSSKTSEDSRDVEVERPSRKKTASKNLDPRSISAGNLKQKTSDVKCKVANKNDRKTRSLANKYRNNEQDNYVVSEKKNDKNLKTVPKSNKANSLVETKLMVDKKRRTSSVDNMKTHESRDSTSMTRSRPPRRTKEAATLFMEMLRKDMRCPDEQEEDDTSSVESFPDLPNTKINEQRERELKVFSKHKIEKHLGEPQQSNGSKNDIKNDQSSLWVSDNKKTAVEKKKVKQKKKNEVNILPVKKKSKEESEIVDIIENGGIMSFQRNLRPRRSSTMLDDYIMTDSEEDEQKPETVIEVKKLLETPKSMSKATAAAGDLKSQKNKLSAEESGKKNLKINKTDLKPKKDLSKIDSEVKKSLSETKSKNNSILLKRDKEPEINNSKSTVAVDKKTEKSSKNKTENVGINTTKEPKTATGESSKNAGKKVLPPSKQHQSTAKKDVGSNKKKPNLDLFNNNKKQPSSTVTSSSSASSSSSMFSSVTSQTKEDLLEHMAANFDAKSADNVSGDGSTVERNEVAVTAAGRKSVDQKMENRKGAVEDEKKPVRPGQKELMKMENVVLTKDKNVGKVEKAVMAGKVENTVAAGKVKNVVSAGKLKNAVVAGKVKNAFAAVSKVKNAVAAGKAENSVAAGKMENADVAGKVENAIAAGKVENVVAMVVGKMEKTESLLAAATPFEQVENLVAFKTLAKDLLLGQQKEIKINIPEYFADKSFQLPNRFKHNDGLSVLSEICSALPRYNEPFVSNRQLMDKLPTVVPDGDSSFAVKYAQSQPALPPLPPLPANGIEKKEEKPATVPPSFESRTMKIVNLARSNGSTAVTVTAAPIATAAETNDKKDLTTSWRQAFKNVKLPKNGLTSTAISIGSNLMAWSKKKQSIDNQQSPPFPLPGKFLTNGVDRKQSRESSPSPQPCQKISCGESKTTEVFSDGGGKKLPVANSSYLAKTTILNSTKYDLKFEKRFSPVAVASAVVTAAPADNKLPLQRKDVVADAVSSSDDQSPEKKIFHQRRLSTTQSCSGNSSDAFSPDNETSVYAFEPDLPVASTPFRRNKPQSPAKSRTVSPNTSIAVSIENDSTEEKSHQSAVSSSTDADSEEGRLFYIPLPAGVQAQPLIQGVTVKLGTEGPQNKLVMSAKLVTKPPASTIPVSSISPKPERKIKPLCSTKITNSSTPVGTVQPTTRTVLPPKSTPSTSKHVLPLSPQLQILDTKDVKKHLQQTTTTNTTATTITTTSTTIVKESKKSSVSSLSSSSSAVDNKKSKKTEKQVINSNKRKSSEKVASKKKSLKEQAVMLDAPTFYPSEEDFKDPLDYFEIIKPVAQKYGICRVVPPASFKPECKVTDDMRFTAYNQYVHKMMNRWGPNVLEMIAMKKYLETQSIVLSNPPLIGGMELDLPRLYHTVQELGGLKEVIELDKWCRVADLMKIPKSAQDRVTKLDDIYCKYLLPYDTLSHDERQKLIAEVDKEWKQICKKGDTEDELFEGVNDCIAKGRNIALSAYYRVARNTVAMWFKEQQQQPMSGHSSTSKKLGAAAVRAEDVESFYWKQVQEKKNHICVLSGSIDSGAEGYGFPTTKNATFTKHPWNLKVLTNNPVSVLKSLGPVMGMTVPTIHMGMVFSACCWYRDPHGLPWIEYLHTGADKVWYGVPADQSDRFRAAMKRLLPRAVAEGQNHHTWLAADSGMVPPDKLLEHGVTLTRTVQNPGQFLIVMPRAYTCNVSTGYVISESVYFTQMGWLNGAEKIFRDLQKNCEPAAFSFEKLLINMSTDSRTPFNILKQLLNLLSNMRDCEVALRSQLVEDLGLKASERIRPPSKSNEQNEDYECDVCHSILYISMVNNLHEDCDYCLRHGIEILSKKHNQLKYCKFLYNFDETELDSILVKLRERIDSKKKKSSLKS